MKDYIGYHWLALLKAQVVFTVTSILELQTAWDRVHDISKHYTQKSITIIIKFKRNICSRIGKKVEIHGGKKSELDTSLNDEVSAGAVGFFVLLEEEEVGLKKMDFNALLYESRYFEGNFPLCVVQPLNVLFTFAL